MTNEVLEKIVVISLVMGRKLTTENLSFESGWPKACVAKYGDAVIELCSKYFKDEDSKPVEKVFNKCGACGLRDGHNSKPTTCIVIWLMAL